jgi:hypothetical protein
LLRKRHRQNVNPTGFSIAIGGTRKRIQKETAKLVRKKIKEKADAGMDMDAALISMSKQDSSFTVYIHAFHVIIFE